MSDPIAALATLRAPSQEDLSTPAQRALNMAEGWKIEDDETYGLAGDELRAIKAKAKSLEEQRTAITSPLNAALRAINALFKGPADMLDKAERLIKTQMIGYTDRKDAERRAAEAAQRAILEAQKDAPPEEAVLAVAIAPPIDAPVRAAGISKVKVTVKARVVDKAAFLAHVSQAPAYLDLIDVNESKLNTLARALGHSLSMPGVEIYEEKSIAARAA